MATVYQMIRGTQDLFSILLSVDDCLAISSYPEVPCYRIVRIPLLFLNMAQPLVKCVQQVLAGSAVLVIGRFSGLVVTT